MGTPLFVANRGAYYNEFDPFAAQWLRNLIAKNLIPQGEVDERSIEDVRPADLRGYVQHHFFAGIGGWAHALEMAGWPSDRRVWTGSCPCQPFSASGKGLGFDDERHLLPAWHYLIEECEPAIIFGEQVSAKGADPWVDLVQSDLEGLGYAFGCIAFPAAGVGAPHLRDRNYWLAHADRARLEGWLLSGERAAQLATRAGVMAGGLADADGRDASAEWEQRGREQRFVAAHGCADALADRARFGRREEHADGGRLSVGNRAQGDATGFVYGGGDLRPGPANGFWRDADWIGCTDGKWRPVEPGAFPLANGIPGRMGRLRGYGNAVVPEAASAFIVTAEEAMRAFQECAP